MMVCVCDKCGEVITDYPATAHLTWGPPTNAAIAKPEGVSGSIRYDLCGPCLKEVWDLIAKKGVEAERHSECPVSLAT